MSDIEPINLEYPDERTYTESEVQAIVSREREKAMTYTQTEVDALVLEEAKNWLVVVKAMKESQRNHRRCIKEGTQRVADLAALCAEAEKEKKS